MSTLLVDLGNTCLKWARLGNDGLQDFSSIIHRNHSFSTLLSKNWDTLEKAQRVLVASVATLSIREQLEKWIKQHWDCRVDFLVSPARGSGLVNSYTDPGRLGCDRWAAMVAARCQADSAFCVVDCGSAITIDVVDETGIHLGGMILPGIYAMLESLGKNTPLTVNDLEQIQNVRLGNSTQAAVEAGILGAIVCLVNQTATAQRSMSDSIMRCFLTGGDAERISHLLNIPFEHQANLVLEGLAIIAREQA